MASGTTKLRVLMRSFETGHFYKNDNQWTSDADEALDFKSVAEAQQFASKQKLKNVEAYLISGGAISGVRLTDPEPQ